MFLRLTTSFLMVKSGPHLEWGQQGLTFLLAGRSGMERKSGRRARGSACRAWLEEARRLMPLGEGGEPEKERTRERDGGI